MHEHDESGQARQEKLYAVSPFRQIPLRRSSVAVTGRAVQRLVALFLLSLPPQYNTLYRAIPLPYRLTK